MLPVARTMYVNYQNGVRLTRLLKDIRDVGYGSSSVTGFICGDIETFALPNIRSMAFWDGTETFYTNYRHVYREDGGYPTNLQTFAYRAVIDDMRGLLYFVDGRDGEIYKLQFVMPLHTRENWYYNPGVMPYPRFDTIYTYPERDTPSIYHKLNPPFCRDVRVYRDGGNWAIVPLAQLRFSELKIINSRLVTSPNFGYGLEAYEVDSGAPVPEWNYVPTIWYLPLWKGDSAQFSNLDIFSSQQAYSAAFDINFGTMEAFVAVNTGHIFPQKAGDNVIFAVAPVVKRVINNGENAPMHIRITGPASLGTFTNRTTEQSIRMDGHYVPLNGVADVVTIPKNGSDIGNRMNAHMLDSSDANMYLAPGKNIMSCNMEDVDTNTTVLVLFRERYASIEKAIEYIGG